MLVSLTDLSSFFLFFLSFIFAIEWVIRVYVCACTCRFFSSLFFCLHYSSNRERKRKMFNCTDIGWVKIIRLLVGVCNWMKWENDCAVSTKFRLCEWFVQFQLNRIAIISFILFLIELRQAARDLHRLQSKYDPTTTSETNNSNPDGSTAEQTRYFISFFFINELILSLNLLEN